MDLSGLSTDQLLQMKQQLSAGNSANPDKTPVQQQDSTVKTTAEPNSIPQSAQVNKTSDVKSTGSGVDLSGLSTEQLLEMKQKLSGKTSPQSNAQVSSRGQTSPQEPVGALGEGVNTGQTNPLTKIGNSDVVSKINAVGGQMSADIGSTIGMVPKLGSAIAQRIGIMSPMQKQAFDASVDQKLAPNQVSQQAIQQHPNYATAGNLAIGALAGGAVGGAAGAAASKAGSLASWMANATASGATYGAVTGEPGSKMSSTIGGAVGGAAAGAIGGVIAKLAQSSAPAINIGLKKLSSQAMSFLADPSKDAQQNAVEAVASHFANAKAVVNAAEDQFRGVPGKFSASDLKGTIDKTLTDFKSELTPSQSAVLQRASAKLSDDLPVGSIVDVKRALNNNYQLFNNKQMMSDELSHSYDNILDSAKGQIAKTMDQAGQSNLYQKFTDTYNASLKPLQDLKINKWANLDPESPDFASKSQSFFNKMVNTNNPGQIQALRKVLSPDANRAVTSQFLSNAVDKATSVDGSLNINGLLGQVQKIQDAGAIAKESPEGQMLDGIRKIALTSKHLDMAKGVPIVGSLVHGGKEAVGSSLYYVGKGLNALTNSSVGQAALMHIGVSTNPNLVTRALEEFGKISGASQGSYQAQQLMK